MLLCNVSFICKLTCIFEEEAENDAKYFVFIGMLGGGGMVILIVLLISLISYLAYKRNWMRRPIQVRVL